MAKRFIQLAIIFGVAAFFTGALLHAQNSSPDKVYTLSKVVFRGSKRFSSAQLISTSGLQIGQKLTLKEVDDASGRLFATGIFSKIGYDFQFSGGSIEVTYDVSDASKFLPCHYDNFVWFTDADLTATVKKEVPLFDGFLPESGTMGEKVSAALDHFLAAHKISGSTVITPEGGIGMPLGAFRAAIGGILIPVVSVNVTGGPLGPDVLAITEKLLLSGNYSAASAHAAAIVGFAESYRDEGYLDVHFAEPVMTMRDPQHTDASQGVSLDYTVTPGALYTWSGADWSGNQILKDLDLTNLMGMKSGEPARRKKITDGWSAVNDAYGHIGYILAKITPVQQLDRAQHQVHYRVTVSEGEQYTMGHFLVRGAPDELVTMIQQAWELHTGDPYDKLYEKTFRERDLNSALSRVSVRTPMQLKFDLMPMLDTQRHVVNVLLQCK
ncbi:MAG: POTRA domain-containing protein [Candidatus Acidiferrales bacterium]